MGWLDVRFLLKTVVPLEELWLYGYADQHDWPILQTSFPTSFMDGQDASSYQSSQGKKCVFICLFVHWTRLRDLLDTFQVRAC